jgi:metacaspase-1
MARGISLHVGLNRVDVSQYPGYIIPVLSGCINDANSMNTVAKAAGFATSNVLIDAQATAMNIKNKISEAASQLCAGDIFFLTYSGHGSQVPDESGEEDDGQNETWVCYDRQLIDDELYTLWQTFKENVQIFVLSDSCHSGTMVKMLISDFVQGKLKSKKDIHSRGFEKSDADILVNMINKSRAMVLKTAKKTRTMPIENSLNNYFLKKELYQNIQLLTKQKKDIDPILASLIYISGCQDNQTSGDGETNGLFTGNLLSVWNSGGFTGDYQGFFNRILALMPSDQTPNYMKLGRNVEPFEKQKPFTIIPPSQGSSATSSDDGITDTNASSSTAITTTSSKPIINGPVSWNSNSLPPAFNVNKGSNPYYYVEFATDNVLFDSSGHGSERNAQNFYATWDDATNNNQFYVDAQFEMPQTAWDTLKTADRIYYRLGTTIDSKWNGWMITVEDSNFQNAPYFSVTHANVSSTDSSDSSDIDNDTSTTENNTSTPIDTEDQNSSDTGDAQPDDNNSNDKNSVLISEA